MRFKDKVAIVTGGAGGIGSAALRAMAREGAKVVVAGWHIDTCEAVAADIRKSGGRAIAVAVDISKQGEVEQMVQKTIAEFGRVDILVNNAATPTAWRKPFHETVPGDWKAEVEVTFMGTLFCCRAVIPHLVEQKSGRIINVGSDSGKIGVPRRSIYSACKAAIAGFTRAIACELAPLGITVNCVSPGPIKTKRNVAGHTGAGPTQAQATPVPIGRMGEPEEVAAMILFLASDEASYITGQDYSVDGGLRM